MKILVAGLGYVGLSNAILLAQNHHVVAYDISAARVQAVNERKSPLVDREIEQYFAEKQLDLTAVSDAASECADADYIIIATPTDYDPKKDYFDTSSVENVIGADVVQAHGGRVHLARLQDGYSTTGICRRISDSGERSR